MGPNCSRVVYQALWKTQILSGAHTSALHVGVLGVSLAASDGGGDEGYDVSFGWCCDFSVGSWAC